MKVRWTEKATADVIGIFDYIARQSSGYAGIVCELILSRPHQLLDHPYSGSITRNRGLMVGVKKTFRRGPGDDTLSPTHRSD